MKAYHDFIVQQQTHNYIVHSSTAPVRSLMDYCLLYNALLDVEEYEPINTNDFELKDRFDIRRWFDKLTLPSPVSLYVYSHGNTCRAIFCTRAMRKKFIDRYYMTGSKLL